MKRLEKQLNIAEKEISEIKKVENRVEARMEYIKALIALEETGFQQTTTYDDLDDTNAKENDSIEEDIDDDLEPEATEPESVTSETDSVVEDPLEDAEEVMIVENEDGEEVDITQAYNMLKNSGLDEETILTIGLYLTEYNCVLQYNEFENLEHSYERAYMAYALGDLGLEELNKKVLEFTGLKKGDVFKIVNNEIAEEVYNFIYGE